MIIAETGEGLANANAYIDITYADAYHSLRGNTAWNSLVSDADVKAKHTSIVRATDYLDQRYPAYSARLVDDQALAYPVKDKGLPEAVRKATAQLALYALNGPLSGPKERGIKMESTKASFGDHSVTYDDPSDADPYPDVTRMLAPLARPTVAMGMVTRVWLP